MKFIPALVLVLCLTGAALRAQEPTPFMLQGNAAHAADWISTGAVAANIGLDAWHTFHDEPRGNAWRFACRIGLPVGVAELTKALVHRTRPDSSDNKSFFSEHTALAAATARGTTGFVFTVTTAWGRQAAGKHYPTDVAVGWGVGYLSQKVCGR